MQPSVLAAVEHGRVMAPTKSIPRQNGILGAPALTRWTATFMHVTSVWTDVTAVPTLCSYERCTDDAATPDPRRPEIHFMDRVGKESI